VALGAVASRLLAAEPKIRAIDIIAGQVTGTAAARATPARPCGLQPGSGARLGRTAPAVAPAASPAVTGPKAAALPGRPSAQRDGRNYLMAGRERRACHGATRPVSIQVIRTGAPHRLAVHGHRPPRSCPWPAACTRSWAASQNPPRHPAPQHRPFPAPSGSSPHPAAQTGRRADPAAPPARPGSAAARPRPIRRPRQTTWPRPAQPPRQPAAPTSGCGAGRADHADQAPAPGTSPGPRTGRIAGHGHRQAELKD
jgi:hypothetical protein